MSFRAVTWAFDVVRGLGANEKLALLALAEFANDDDETWRSAREIAARVECSPRSLKTHLGNLEDRGFIERSARYAWCDDAEGPCAGRPPHKHRSGTTYKLRLDRREALPLEDTGLNAAPVSVPSTPSQSASRNMVDDSAIVRRSTGATFAPVAKVAESGGKVHKCKSCTCEDSGGSTGANPGIPQVQPVAPVLREEPPINPPTNQPNLEAHQARSRSVGQEVDSRDAAAPGGAAPPAIGPVSDRLLVAECLPEHLRALDTPGLAEVAGLLRERLAAGWSSRAISRVMDQPLPDQVGRLAGIVAHRLRANVDPLAPPVAPARGSRAVAVAAPKPPFESAWDDLVWDPAFVEVGGRDTRVPSEIISAGKAATAVLAARGLTVQAWPGFWAEAVQARPDLDPEDETAWSALVEVARDLASERLLEAAS